MEKTSVMGAGASTAKYFKYDNKAGYTADK